MPWNIIIIPAIVALVYGVYKATGELKNIHKDYELEDEEKSK